MTNHILLADIMGLCQVEWKRPTAFLLVSEEGIVKRAASSPLEALQTEQ